MQAKVGSRSPSTGSKATRTQNATKVRKRGQDEASRGQARFGNQNAKKVLEWLSTYDLSSPQGVDAFMQEVIKRTWTGELGTRAAGALNGSLRILLEHLTLPALEKRIEMLEASRGEIRNLSRKGQAANPRIGAWR